MFEVDETIHQQDPRSTYKFWICIMVLLIAVINICWLDMKMIREIEARFGTFFVSIYLAVVEWAPSINQHK